MNNRLKLSPSVLVKGLAAVVLTASASVASAADGCKFLLCIAGPWTTIPECRPTVYEVFRDLAKGKAFPSCAMSGAGNSAGNTWMSESTCPPMYRRYNDYSSFYEGCTYSGRISVYINGGLWSQVYWDTSKTSTWYSEAAKASLSQPGTAPLDNTFENDVAAWNSVEVNKCKATGGSAVFDEFGAYSSCKPADGGWGN